MDVSKIFDLANTSVEGGGGGPSFLDQLGNLAIGYGAAYTATKFDVNGTGAAQDTARGEQQANLNARIAEAQISSQSLVLIAAAIVAGVVLYKVL